MAGLSGPARRELPPPQLKGVPDPPASIAEGDVRDATGGSFVPPGVSGAPGPRRGSPPPLKDFSKGFGSWVSDGC